MSSQGLLRALSSDLYKQGVAVWECEAVPCALLVYIQEAGAGGTLNPALAACTLAVPCGAVERLPVGKACYRLLPSCCSGLRASLFQTEQTDGTPHLTSRVE